MHQKDLASYWQNHNYLFLIPLKKDVTSMMITHQNLSCVEVPLVLGVHKATVLSVLLRSSHKFLTFYLS